MPQQIHKTSHDDFLWTLVHRAAKRDEKVGSGDVHDFAIILARIVWREAVRRERSKHPARASKTSSRKPSR